MRSIDGPDPWAARHRWRLMRHCAGWSRERLAGRLRVTASIVGAWENGTRTPTPSHRRRLDDLLHRIVDPSLLEFALALETVADASGGRLCDEWRSIRVAADLTQADVAAMVDHELDLEALARNERRWSKSALSSVQQWEGGEVSPQPARFRAYMRVLRTIATSQPSVVTPNRKRAGREVR